MAKQTIPPRLSDEELAALSIVTPAERKDAAKMWRADAPRAAKEMLDAEEDV